MSFQVVAEIAEARPWQLGMLCKKKTDEVLVCPLSAPVVSRRELIFETYLKTYTPP